MSGTDIPYMLFAPTFHLTWPPAELIAYSVAPSSVGAASSFTVKNTSPFAVAGAVISSPSTLVTHCVFPDSVSSAFHARVRLFSRRFLQRLEEPLPLASERIKRVETVLGREVNGAVLDDRRRPCITREIPGGHPGA